MDGQMGQVGQEPGQEGQEPGELNIPVTGEEQPPASQQPPAAISHERVSEIINQPTPQPEINPVMEAQPPATLEESIAPETPPPQERRPQTTLDRFRGLTRTTCGKILGLAAMLFAGSGTLPGFTARAEAKVPTLGDLQKQVQRLEGERQRQREAGQEATQSSAETALLNEEIRIAEVNLTSSSMVVIDQEKINVEGDTYNGRDALAQRLIVGVRDIFFRLGIGQIRSLEELQAETEARQTEREGAVAEEIQPGPAGNVPERGTAIVASHQGELSLTVVHREQRQELDQLGDILGINFRLEDIKVEKKAAQVVISLVVTEVSTGKKCQIVATGADEDVTRFEVGGISTEQESDNERENQALEAALKNLEQLLREKLKAPGGIEAQVTGVAEAGGVILVEISAGENNGVKNGMEFEFVGSIPDAKTGRPISAGAVAKGVAVIVGGPTTTLNVTEWTELGQRLVPDGKQRIDFLRSCRVSSIAPGPTAPGAPQGPSPTPQPPAGPGPVTPEIPTPTQ